MSRNHFNSVFITGASSGIGMALAYEFAACGAVVTIAARSEDKLKAIQSDLQSGGGKCHVIACDVRDQELVKKAVSFAIERMGGIDLAILNAGIGDPEWMVNFESEYIKNTFAVNVFGMVHAMEYLIPYMREGGGGVIAGTSSVTDVRGYPGSGSYCASKAAATTLLEAARTELLHEGIHVATVRPGFVKTPMTAKNDFPMPFMISAGKAARIIRRRLEKKRNVITFPWYYYLVSEIVRVLPDWFYTPVAGRVRRKEKGR